MRSKKLTDAFYVQKVELISSLFKNNKNKGMLPMQQEEIVKQLQKFREKIYQNFPSRRDAAIELIDALSSNKTATSVVELSLSSLHRRNYCSITRVLDEYLSTDVHVALQQKEILTHLLSSAIPPLSQRAFDLFVADCTPESRMFSPTLEDRSFVYAPNAVCGNKPVTIGHKYSIVTYMPEKSNPNTPPWVIPLACTRVDTTQNGELLGMQQVAACIKSQSAFSSQLSVSLGDTAYNNPLCLGVAKNNANQVHISRARNNRRFFYPHVVDEATEAKKRGRPKAYGDIHQLNDSSTWRAPDESLEFIQTSVKGKVLTIKIDCWNEVIMRGKKDTKLSDYPLRLLRVQVYKESGELLFKRPFWLTAAGKRRMELSLLDIFSSYRQRFDIEHFFRFGKNRLLMDKLQTPDIRHEETWWQLVMIAYTQLYLARTIANSIPNPWENYLPFFKKNETIKPPTQVQNDFERIIQMIGTPAQPPKPRKKSPGRQLGDIQTKRIRHPIVKRQKNSATDEKMVA